MSTAVDEVFVTEEDGMIAEVVNQRIQDEGIAYEAVTAETIAAMRTGQREQMFGAVWPQNETKQWKGNIVLWVLKQAMHACQADRIATLANERDEDGGFTPEFVENSIRALPFLMPGMKDWPHSLEQQIACLVEIRDNERIAADIKHELEKFGSVRELSVGDIHYLRRRCTDFPEDHAQRVQAVLIAWICELHENEVIADTINRGAKDRRNPEELISVDSVHALRRRYFEEQRGRDIPEGMEGVEVILTMRTSYRAHSPAVTYYGETENIAD